MLVAKWSQDWHPCEISVLLVLLVNDLLLILFGGDEPIGIWNEVSVVLVVQVGGEFRRVENVEGYDVGESCPLLVDRAIPGEVDPLEAGELVLLVLIDAELDLLSGNFGDLPLRYDFLDAFLQALAAINKPVNVALEVL